MRMSADRLFNEFIAPGFVLIDDTADLMVKQQQLTIRMNSNSILCFAYSVFEAVYNGNILI